MEIKLGNIYINKTKKYLVPCLREYGQDFTSRVSNLYKLAMGIGDFALEEMGKKFKNHIFILVDANLSQTTFLATLNWLKLQEYHAFDYAYDDIHLGHLHMLVIEVPGKYLPTLENFKEGKFSKMYVTEEFIHLFEHDSEQVKVFTKDKEQMFKFVEKVNTIFNTNVEPEKWDGELEFPILTEEEYFNL